MSFNSSSPTLRLCSSLGRQFVVPPRPFPRLHRIAAMSISTSSELDQVTEGRVRELEARVAELHLKAQALNKQPGREAEATAVYKELAALDDEALELKLSGAQPPTATAITAIASTFPAFYSPLLPPSGWRSAENRCRAINAVLGAALGDAAACSCQWVYSEPAMAALAVSAAERGTGLEFFDPPQCPFFSYPLGSPSPYFEQAAVLLRSLVEAGRLDLTHYAAAVFAAFGPGYAGYRDRSTKNFLRRYAAGAAPPLTGTVDDQANAFARLPPLVALHAGAERGELVAAVERMIRVTQNDPVAVAYGTAAALILEAVVQGANVAAAVASTVDWLLGQEAQQVVLHLEYRQAQQAQQQEQGQAQLTVQQHAQERPGDLPKGQAGAWPAEQEVTALSHTTAAEGDDAGACLPCSMGACPLPGTPAERSATAGRRVLAAIQEQQHAGSAAQLPPEAFLEGVRLAIRPGGCCASRAGFVGALLGALGMQLPADWEGRVLGYASVRQHAELLVRLRD
ncbi:hypothetical protein ABPG77_009441 [Micractinium sp. CCAP 211/92]